MDKICEFDKCTGCSACYNICPVHAIEMGPFAPLGDIHPRIEQEKCIDCHLCEKVCPVNHPVELRSPLRAIAMISKDKEDLMSSASGGASSVLSRTVIEQGGVVYGCVENSYKDIAHRRITTLSDLYKLKGSKYVQSDINDIYRQVKQDLGDGKTVLFTGTPCQNGGLKNFLRKDYPNLYLVDLCCHGVPSQEILRRDCEYLLRYAVNKPTGEAKVTFRVKYPYKENTDEPFSVFFGGFIVDGDGHRLKIRGKRDEFLRDDYITAFMSGLIFRDSCYTCTYAGARRCSDITIADFWGLNRCKVPQANGVSLLLINTEKGMALAKDSLRETIWEERPVSEAINGNGQFIHPSAMPDDREQFLKEYSANPRYAYKKHLHKYRHQYRARLYSEAFTRFLKRHKLIAKIDSRCPILSMVVGKAIYEYSKR